jgi:hypothetical protein
MVPPWYGQSRRYLQMTYDSFTLTDHAKLKDGLIVAYNCPVCGHLYAWGSFTLENEECIVARSETISCCGNDLPLPAIFDTRAEAHDYLYNPPKNTEIKIVLKKDLQIAHIDLTYFEAQWNKHRH